MTNKNFIDDFYPTPAGLIDKMTAKITWSHVATVLEPSAGKGDIVDAIKPRVNKEGYYNNKRIDVIEINPDLQHILRGKNFNLIHDDFLSFTTHQRYDLIIANFPFSQGDAHLSHALALIKKNGGRLVCLVNAETIRKQYTRLREEVTATLLEMNADITYLPGEFTNAQRRTSVEVALIDVRVEKELKNGIILEHLKQAEIIERQSRPQEAIVSNDFKQGLIERFNFEAKAGVTLIEDYEALSPFFGSYFSKDGKESSSYLIELKIPSESDYKFIDRLNSFLKRLRQKYWRLLVHDERFSNRYTSNILSEIHSQMNDLQYRDFTIFNIEELERQLQTKIQSGIETAIVDLFATLTRGHTYNENIHNSNVHYFNGWRSNLAHKVNKKVVIPLHGYSAWSKDFDYRAKDRLHDIHKVFQLLDTPRSAKLLTGANGAGDGTFDIYNVKFIPGRTVTMPYFEVKTFIKGTCHIKFTNQDLLDKFNIYAAKKKNWLPPGYGRQAYDEMTVEAQTVIDSFQGKEAYNKVCLEPDFYLSEALETKLLTDTNTN